ncbi:hypothetical protein CEY11_21350 [Candidimonas nitroreducens]|uniref:Uncharacterized protein n=2 Tax=Candidimonas nitroreducens TaxID=683354 RepID=A0A225M8H8_9BURK|nr:hypothetical protein CEY11_21350 [Candidimonas nitroreducens]
MAQPWGDESPVAAPVQPTPQLQAPRVPALPEPQDDDIDEDGGEPVERPARRLSIGQLAELAMGRMPPGVTPEDAQSELAVMLREVDPKEIEKAMGLQAAEQQLKSGAFYGAVLADLIKDMAAGGLKPELKIKLATLLARVGRVDPKDDGPAGMGSGFQLIINMDAAARAPVTVDMEPA